MNAPGFAYTARATQVIAGCSNKINTYLLVYLVVKYSMEFVAFVHASSSSGFVSNGSAKWFGRHHYNDAKQPVTRNFYTTVCDVSRCDWRRTYHTNEILSLVRGML